MEGAFTLAALVVAALLGRRRIRRSPYSGGLRRLASRRSFAAAFVFVVTLSGQLLALPVFGIPEPQVADEYAYLLAGETFAAGRLTNPAHPSWSHLETAHVLQQPTYMAMYPPGQGLLLALGIAAWGSPIVGVWLSVAGAAAAITRALQLFGPARWALVGGLFFGVRLGMFTYWSWSYWGGALAALGGALALAGAAGFGRRPGAGDGLTLGAGLALLALTRPFEGIAVGLPAIAAAGVQLLRRSSGPSSRRFPVAAVILVIAPVLAVIASLAAWNRAVTGSAWTFPYALQRETYAVSRHLVWQEPRPEPVHRHAVLRDFYTRWEPENFGRFGTRRDGRAGPAAYLAKLVPIWTFFFGPVLTPALLFAPLVLARRRNRLVAATLAGAGLAFLSTAWWIVPHYAAPATAALWVVVVEGLRRLRVAARRARLRPGVPVAAVCSVLLVVSAARIAAPNLGLRLGAWPPAWYSTIRYAGYTRNALQEELVRRGGRHLVFVRYAPGHSPHLEWVYNGADLAAAPVFWARSMGEPADALLARHETGRTVWLLEPDADPWSLRSYSPGR